MNNEVNGLKARRKRLRASVACDACHSRKVRCDITSRGPPCSNCTAYSVGCEPHAPKARVWSKRRQAKQCMPSALPPRTESTDGADHSPSSNPSPGDTDGSAPVDPSQKPAPLLGASQTPSPSPRQRSPARDLYLSTLPREIHNSMPRFEYLGESTGLFPLHDERDNMDIHHPLSYGSSSLVSGLDPFDVAELDRKGAFTIPEKPLRDELINEFFQWVAPILPVVNKSLFLSQYQACQEGNLPSLLLLHAMFLAASKVSKSPLLLRALGSGLSASTVFYRRAKALYDADYEPDRVVVLQSLILMGWYCEDPRGVGTTFHWSRIAIALAQSIGMHRSVTSSNLSLSKKRLYKRLWWALFVRDRLTSVCLGRPMGIHLDDCDVEVLDESDFLEQDADVTSLETGPSDRVHALFFLQLVKVSKIVGQIFSAYYSASSKPAFQTHLDYDRRLATWLQQRPPQMVWQKSAPQFWPSVLHLHYCTAICLLHKAHMSIRQEAALSEVHISRCAAYDSADSITDIVEGLLSSGELRYCPPFIVHSLYSALLIHVHRILKDSGPALFPMISRAEVCLNACRELSKSWTAATMTDRVFSHLLASRPERESQSTSSDAGLQSPYSFSLFDLDPALVALDVSGH